MKRHQLSDLEIDEVSTVDRPANQHGLITFSKSTGMGEGYTEEVTMPGENEIEVFDADGQPIDELAHGDVVYDQDGNEFPVPHAEWSVRTRWG